MKKGILIYFVIFNIHAVYSQITGSDINIQKELIELNKRQIPSFSNKEIEQNIAEWLKNENNGTSIIAGRYNMYKPYIDSIRKKYDLPWFVTLIPAANTGFEPKFKDQSGYAGMWPLGYLIGKKYELTETALYDERRDPFKSTMAACKYLKELQNIYQDWLKTITAFRIGPARLNQVIHASGTLDFNIIYSNLEPEERLPILQFYAAAIALNIGIEKEIIKPTAINWVKSDTVHSISQIVPFSILNEKFNISVSEFRNLNPGLKTDFIPYMGRPFVFKLPVNKVNDFKRKRDSIPIWLNIEFEPKISFDTIVEVFDGDTATIIQSNQELTNEVVINTPQIKVPKKTWVYYKIKRGDAIFTLTDIFDCTESEIKQWNHVYKKNFLIVGKVIRFNVDSEKKLFYKQINTMTLKQKRALANKD
jgi:membrane-bound lytic murein transglycosylase D